MCHYQGWLYREQRPSTSKSQVIPLICMNIFYQCLLIKGMPKSEKSFALIGHVLLIIP